MDVVHCQLKDHVSLGPPHEHAAIAVTPIKKVTELEHARDNNPGCVASRQDFADATKSDRR